MKNKFHKMFDKLELDDYNNTRGREQSLLRVLCVFSSAG